MLINYVKRAFVWSALYYGLTFISIFYLYSKDTIEGWNGLLVLIPLFFIGISTETMSKKKELNTKRLKPYSLLDFWAKLFAFVFAQCIYRKIINVTLQGWYFAFIVLICVFSIVMEMKMFMIVKREKR